MSPKARGGKKTLARLLAALMITALIAGMFPAVALAASANSASFTGNTIPAKMVAGQSYTVKITVKNTGSATWTAAAGYKLVCTAGGSNFSNNAGYPLPATVKPNASATFSITLTAPLKKGRFTTSWRMSKGGTKFGPTLTKRVSVAIAANNSRVAGSSFPTDITVSIDPYTLTATFKNTGSVVWTSQAGYSLAVTFSMNITDMGKDSENFTVPLSSGDSIKLGGTKQFVMPQDYSIFPMEGSYTYTMQMVCNGVGFGPTLIKKVTAKYTASQIQSMAEIMVEMAEEYKDQDDVDEAQLWINRMPAGSDRKALQTRLDAVQAAIDLAGAKSDAHAALQAALAKYHKADYSLNNWSQLIMAKTDGDTAIDSATAVADVSSAKSTAINAMKAVKTSAQELADEKAAAHSALSAALARYNRVDYSPANWSALKNAKATGDADINKATTAAAVDTARDTALAAMAAVKTGLATQKAAAHTALSTALAKYHQADYSASNWALLNLLKTNGDAAVDAAETVPAVYSAKNSALSAMASIKTKAQEALDAEKTSAHTILAAVLAGYRQDFYSAEDWAGLTAAKAAGDTAINKATTIAAVDAARDNALAAMAAFKWSD